MLCPWPWLLVELLSATVCCASAGPSEQGELDRLRGIKGGVSATARAQFNQQFASLLDAFRGNEGTVHLDQFPADQFPRLYELNLSSHLAEALRRSLSSEELGQSPEGEGVRALPLFKQPAHQMLALLRPPPGINQYTRPQYLQWVQQQLPLYAQTQHWHHVLKNFDLFDKVRDRLPRLFGSEREEDLRGQWQAYHDCSQEVQERVAGILPLFNGRHGELVSSLEASQARAEVKGTGSTEKPTLDEDDDSENEAIEAIRWLFQNEVENAATDRVEPEASPAPSPSRIDKANHSDSSSSDGEIEEAHSEGSSDFEESHSEESNSFEEARSEGFQASGGGFSGGGFRGESNGKDIEGGFDRGGFLENDPDYSLGYETREHHLPHQESGDLASVRQDDSPSGESCQSCSHSECSSSSDSCSDGELKVVDWEQDSASSISTNPGDSPCSLQKGPYGQDHGSSSEEEGGASPAAGDSQVETGRSRPKTPDCVCPETLAESPKGESRPVDPAKEHEVILAGVTASPAASPETIGDGHSPLRGGKQEDSSWEESDSPSDDEEESGASSSRWRTINTRGAIISNGGRIFRVEVNVQEEVQDEEADIDDHHKMIAPEEAEIDLDNDALEQQPIAVDTKGAPQIKLRFVKVPRPPSSSE